MPPQTELRDQGQVPVERLAQQVESRLRVLVAYSAAYSRTLPDLSGPTRARIT